MAYTNIDDPSAYFQTAIYTGTNNSNAITNDGNSDLQPDWIWIKRRDYDNGHQLLDSTRGVTKILGSELATAETTLSGRLASFNTDGFTVESSSGAFNANGEPFVAWQWKANGGTTSTDTTSSINSTVQVNSDAGFSIVTYTGNGNTLGGFGHGLGVAPKVVFVKRRNDAANWCVYHKDMGAEYFMKLDSGDAKATGPWQDLDPSSNTVIVYSGALVNGNGSTYVAYCFAEKQGYSKFGSYIGNGQSLNGPFVYTGFKPAWVMIKNTETASRNWYIYDIKRRTFNANGTIISANTASAEATDQAIDVLSNGFKVKPGALGSFGTSNINHSGQKMIYMAFAENPFVTSTGIPTTAR